MVLNLPEKFEDRIACAHKEVVAVVKPIYDRI